jgi:hypothetical protein
LSSERFASGDIADSIIPVVAKTATGKPLFKASEGGRIDILREWEDITQSELQQGPGT